MYSYNFLNSNQGIIIKQFTLHCFVKSVHPISVKIVLSGVAIYLITSPSIYKYGSRFVSLRVWPQSPDATVGIALEFNGTSKPF